MNGLTFRPALASDSTPLATLEAAVTSYPWSARQYRDSITTGHNADIAVLDNKIAGAAIWMLMIDEVDLLNIFIAQPYQSQGLGRQLLQQVITTAKLAGAKRMVLEVRRSNLTAQQLYRSSGFRECGLRKGYYRHGNNREDALLMELIL